MILKYNDKATEDYPGDLNPSLLILVTFPSSQRPRISQLKTEVVISYI